MNGVFLDTVGLLALWDEGDQWHAAAADAFAQAHRQPHPTAHHNFILLECDNAAARRPYRRGVNALRQVLLQRGELTTPSEQDWQLAWEAFDRGESGGAGIVDHVSFVVMRRLDIKRVFSNDKHFAAAGFQVLV